MRRIRLLFLAAAIIALAGCGKESGNNASVTLGIDDGGKASVTPVIGEIVCDLPGEVRLDDFCVVSFPFEHSDEGVGEFQTLCGEQGVKISHLYDDDVCRNITPKEISEKFGFTVFKYSSSTASYLQYDGVVYPLGECFGGWGVMSFAVADLDRNGWKELFFTYSWGSGIHRSLLGYFDTRERTVKEVPCVYWNEDMFLSAEDGNLYLYRSEFEVASDSELSYVLKERLAEIFFDGTDMVLETAWKIPEGFEIPYRLTVTGDYAPEVFLRRDYYEGEMIDVKLPTITEHYYVVTLNGENVEPSGSDMEFTEFHFTMPDRDSILEINGKYVDIPEPLVTSVHITSLPYSESRERNYVWQYVFPLGGFAVGEDGLCKSQRV